jgi:hypothetical protein
LDAKEKDAEVISAKLAKKDDHDVCGTRALLRVLSQGIDTLPAQACSFPKLGNLA